MSHNSKSSTFTLLSAIAVSVWVVVKAVAKKLFRLRGSTINDYRNECGIALDAAEVSLSTLNHFNSPNYILYNGRFGGSAAYWEAFSDVWFPGMNTDIAWIIAGYTFQFATPNIISIAATVTAAINRGEEIYCIANIDATISRNEYTMLGWGLMWSQPVIPVPPPPQPQSIVVSRARQSLYTQPNSLYSKLIQIKNHYYQ